MVGSDHSSHVVLRFLPQSPLYGGCGVSWTLWFEKLRCSRRGKTGGAVMPTSTNLGYFDFAGADVCRLLDYDLTQATVQIVHDDGVYMVPARWPKGQRAPVQIRPTTVVGRWGPGEGDDWVEPVEKSGLFSIRPGDTLRIRMTETEMTFEILPARR